MSTGLICPNCSAATTFHRPPVSACPQCQQPFPDELQRSAELNLAQQRVARPMLISFGMIGSALWAILWIILLGLAPFNLGSYDINGQEVSGPEFLREAGVTLVALTLLSAAIAIGIYRERAWSRFLMLSYWAVTGAFQIVLAIRSSGGAAEIATAVLMALIYVGAAGWYLYGKENVVEYYKVLEASDAAREHA
jgi:hypothetical protein